MFGARPHNCTASWIRTSGILVTGLTLYHLRFYETSLSSSVFYYRPFQGDASFVDLFVICLFLCHAFICFLQHYGYLLRKADLLALLYMMFSCVLSLFCYNPGMQMSFYQTLYHAVSWVRWGTWLYRLLIFALFLTLCINIRRAITWLFILFQCLDQARAYETFFMLNSTEHEISTANRD